MKKEDLQKILRLHGVWVRGDGGVCAILSGANLRGANLSGANLIGAILSDAILSCANLRGAIMWSTIGNGRELKSIHCGTYDIAFTRDVMQIGCKRFLVADWFSFDDKAIASMDVGALDFWRVWKPILQQIVEASK